VSFSRFKRTIAPAVYKIAEQLGYYQDWSQDERRFSQREAVNFSGEIPPMAGNEFNQYRLKYDVPRNVIGHASNVIYTAKGMAWVNGRLIRRLSFQETNLQHLLDRPSQPTRRLERGTILQAQTPKTFGDWMSEHVSSLSIALNQLGTLDPLILPSHWLAKPYVQRDLERLGIEAIAIDEPIEITKVTVLNKTRPGHYWTDEEALNLRLALKVTPRPARPGSAVYLSRLGEKGEGPQRQMNNVLIEEAMKAAGVAIIRTSGRSLEEYMAAAATAETVFADHGSAIYNLIYWQTRRVVELHSPEYWDGSFLMFADGLGIHDYHVWMVGETTTVNALRDRTMQILAKQIERNQTPVMLAG
jgi:capsular polysaccharide biosynthesis protein